MADTAPKFEETIGEFDYCTRESYPDHLYTPTSVATPIQGFESIDETALEQYRRFGFLAIEHAFTKQETTEALEGLIDLIDGKNPDFKTIQFEAWATEQLATMDRDEKQLAVRKLMSFHQHDPRLKAIAEHPRLHEVLLKLLGAEPKMFQDIALLKPPGGREKPWHQDMAYFNYPIQSPVVGAWIALDDATLDNGCMVLMPGGHREGPRVHFRRRDWQICDEDALDRQVVAAPLKAGGLLLFDGLLPHGTPTNTSDRRRRAIQFHYIASEVDAVPEADRLAIFGSEGKNVSC